MSVLLSAAVCALGGNDTGGKINLVWYQWFDAETQKNELTPIVQEFEKVNPNVHIELAAISSETYWDRLALDIASGVEGDIVTLDTGAGLYGYYSQREGGAFLPLDSYIKGKVLADGTDLEKDVYLINSVKIDGKVVGLPYIMFSAPMTAYSKSKLAAAGIKPEALASWDSYYDAAKKLTIDANKDGTPDVYGWGHPTFVETLSRWWHMHWLWTAGGGIFPKEAGPYTPDRLIFNSPENSKAVEFMKKMYRDTAPQGTKTVTDIHAMFCNGSVATCQAAVWTIANFKSMMSDSRFADDLGLGVIDEDIVKYIIADQNFHTNGKFDKELYKNTLKRARIPQSEYEESLKNVILLDKLRHALNIPTKKQDTDMLLASYLMQDRISMQVVEADDNEIKIDEDAVKTLWEEHKNEYKTMTEFKLDTKFIPAITSEANATELRAFYDENKNEYKGSDDKIKDFEAVKDEVLKDFNLKQTKKIALEEYLKIKKGESEAGTTISTLEDNASLPIDELKLVKTGETLKPFEYDDGYMIVKVKEVIAPRVMSFEEAREQILELYKEQKTKEIVEAKAKELLKNGFKGIDIGFIGRDAIKAQGGLTEGEFNVFVSKLFGKSAKKDYVMIDNKAVVYEILEQNLINRDKESEYKDIIAQQSSYLKNSELMRDLSTALAKRYKVEYYVSKK